MELAKPEITVWFSQQDSILHDHVENNCSLHFCRTGHILLYISKNFLKSPDKQSHAQEACATTKQRLREKGKVQQEIDCTGENWRKLYSSKNKLTKLSKKQPQGKKWNP